MSERPESRYAQEVGREALERQRLLAKNLHRCCGEHKDGPHHEACRHFVPDALPAVIDGQETLV